jgi:hypothetical protein
MLKQRYHLRRQNIFFGNKNRVRSTGKVLMERIAKGEFLIS